MWQGLNFRPYSTHWILTDADLLWEKNTIPSLESASEVVLKNRMHTNTPLASSGHKPLWYRNGGHSWDTRITFSYTISLSPINGHVGRFLADIYRACLCFFACRWQPTGIREMVAHFVPNANVPSTKVLDIKFPLSFYKARQTHLVLVPVLLPPLASNENAFR
jgi:hypothetical protein